MVQINFAQKQINAKVVYYGPGMSGKTTNLEVVHQRAPNNNRGDLTSISTDGDRTLFFDYMPLDLGTIAGMKTCFQMYTVPGQVYYNSTRKLVLQGVDGVIFIADSSPDSMEANIESLRNLEENLNEYGKSLTNLPHVIQFNKRDLPDAMSLEEMTKTLNQYGGEVYEAVASTGQGVFPTLKALAGQVLRSIQAECSGQASPSLSRTGFHKNPKAAETAGAAPDAAQPQAQQPAAAGSGSLDLKPAAPEARPAAPLPVGTNAPTPVGAQASAAPAAPAPTAPRIRPASAEPAATPAQGGAGQLMRRGSGNATGSAAARGGSAAPEAARPRSGAQPARRGSNADRRPAPAEESSGMKPVVLIAAAAAIGAAVAFGLLKFL